MSLRQLPAGNVPARPQAFQCDPPADVLARWAPQAATTDDPASVSIFEAIGNDPWDGSGWTAKRMAGVLRSIGARDVTVSINSPGGDVFEGIAIYNLLREHQAKVTVRVMGLAASAASVIAMAGDEILVGTGAFVMVHDAWGYAIGNRHDLRAAADVLEPIDTALADIYAARTGQTAKKCAALMDANGGEGTWLPPATALELGFADALLSDGAGTAQAAVRADVAARHRMDVLLARQGVPRAERRQMFRDLQSGGTPSAAAPATHDAGLSDAAASLQRLLANLTS